MHLQTDNSIDCFGRNHVGQLGNGNKGDSLIPVSVTLINDATYVAAGMEHACAIRAMGAVWCWGRNDQSQITGMLADSHTPIDTGLKGATKVGCGNKFSCAMLSSGEVWCWGNNGQQQLGDNSITERSTPVQAMGVTDAVDLTVGYEHACVLRSTGVMSCWGRNDEGQLGDDSTLDAGIPTNVMTIP